VSRPRRGFRFEPSGLTRRVPQPAACRQSDDGRHQQDRQKRAPPRGVDVRYSSDDWLVFIEVCASMAIRTLPLLWLNYRRPHGALPTRNRLTFETGEPTSAR
jgi:hypothetical protein